MGIAKVSDIKSFLPGTAGVNDVKAANEAGTVDFARVISDAAAKNAPAVQTASADAVKQPPQSTRPVRKADNADSGRIKDSGNEGTMSKAGEIDKGKLEEKINEKVDKIKTAIKDKLGVTDEDVDEAMAAMGMAPSDLLNPDNLKGLMLELSDETDSLALITNEELLVSITDVTRLAAEMLAELQDEFGITAGDLEALFNPVENNMETLVPVDVSSVTEEENDSDTDGNGGVRVEITR
ncbi:MAG: hypothetical protein IKP31_01235, partial [Lachnospiraceae bacterium]|nr:hypothetical protein [Lachnospiraceae bacterium]